MLPAFVAAVAVVVATNVVAVLPTFAAAGTFAFTAFIAVLQTFVVADTVLPAAVAEVLPTFASAVAVVLTTAVACTVLLTLDFAGTVPPTLRRELPTLVAAAATAVEEVFAVAMARVPRFVIVGRLLPTVAGTRGRVLLTFVVAGKVLVVFVVVAEFFTLAAE